MKSWLTILQEYSISRARKRTGVSRISTFCDLVMRSDHKKFWTSENFLESRLAQVPIDDLGNCYPDQLGNSFALVGSTDKEKKLFFVGAITEASQTGMSFCYGQLVDNCPPGQHYYKRWGKNVYSFEENIAAYVGPVVLKWAPGVSRLNFHFLPYNFCGSFFSNRRRLTYIGNTGKRQSSFWGVAHGSRSCCQRRNYGCIWAV